MRLVRPLVGLALLSTAAFLAVPASAAAPQTITDIAGDANGINDEGIFGVSDGVATPAGSEAGNDLLKVELAPTVFKKTPKSAGTCNGFTVKMTLGAPPSAMSRYRLNVSTAVNSTFILFDYDTAVNVTEMRYKNADVDDTVPLTVPAKVDGSTITLTVTEADLKAAGETLKSVLLAPQAQVSKSAQGLLYVPVMDLTPVGQDWQICS